MAIVGYCPRIAVASLDAGKKDTLMAILGGFVGALLYAIVFPYIKPYLVDTLSFGR